MDDPSRHDQPATEVRLLPQDAPGADPLGPQDALKDPAAPAAAEAAAREHQRSQEEQTATDIAAGH